jgi:hypothetical protein
MNIFGRSNNHGRAAILENEDRVKTLTTEVLELDKNAEGLRKRSSELRVEIDLLQTAGKLVVTEKTSRERVDAMLRELFSEEERIALIKMARRIYGYLNEHSYEFGPLLQLVFKYHICYVGQDVWRDPDTHI